MGETLWVAPWLLGLAATGFVPERRRMAAAVFLKGLVSYVGFALLNGRIFNIHGLEVPGDLAPTITDILIGTVAIPVCLSHRGFRGDLLAVLFVVFPLIHWTYWSGAEVALWFASGYDIALRFAFSAMVAALFPWERLNVVLDCSSRLRMALRGPSRVFGKAAGHRCRASSRSAATDRG